LLFSVSFRGCPPIFEVVELIEVIEHGRGVSRFLLTANGFYFPVVCRAGGVYNGTPYGLRFF
jgi:hypothetical protein